LASDVEDEFPTWIKDPMQLLLVHYFDPVTRRVKLRMFDWALKHLDEFLDKILGIPIIKDLEIRVQLEEYLRSEIIFTVMQLCEDLVYAFETYKFTNPDPVVTFKTILKAPKFFAEVKDREVRDLLDWLSWPPEINFDARRSEVTEALDQIREFLERVKKFYFQHLQLYNCYKHGSRVAYLSHPDPGDTEEPYATMLYFPPEKNRNVAVVTRIDDATDALKLAGEILYISSVTKQNWLARKRDEEGETISLILPTKRELDQQS